MNLKVCHFWYDYSPGLFDHTHPLCLKNNIDSIVICANFIENGVAVPNRVFPLRKPSVKDYHSLNLFYRVKRKTRNFITHAKYVKFSNEYLDKFNPDVIHCHFGHTAQNLEPILIQRGSPVIVSFYGVDISSGVKDPKNIDLLKKYFEINSLFLVLCSEAKKRLINIGCPEEKIKIWNLPPGIENYPKRARIFDGVTRFLIAARFVEKKGHKYLLEAYRRLRQKREDVDLTLYGYGPSDNIERMIEELGLKNKCTLINNQYTPKFNEEFRVLLNSHDVFLVPSVTAENGDDEGGPALTMILAQSAGLPVICTDFPGSEISLIPDKTGLLCKQNDVESLSNTMEIICSKPQLWKILGSNAHNLVKQEFSLESQEEKLMSIYQGVLT